MHLVILFGPPAVGKMTVGTEIARRTGLRLFHNHLTVDLALRFFEFGTPPFGRLVGEFRRRIFEEVAASDLPGLVFTYVWALDDPRDRAFVEEVIAVFASRGTAVHFVELAATQTERLRRNETPFRIAQKWPKRDLARSRAHLLETDATYRLNTDPDGRGFPLAVPHLRLDTTDLSAAEAADHIVAALGLPPVAGSAPAP